MPPPPSPLDDALRALARGDALDARMAAAAFGELIAGRGTPAQAAGLLMGLRARGETPDDLAGAVRALRAAMVRVATPDGQAVIDTCGTGGGRVPTFNISTAAALVATAAGVLVAKHGNRSYTSRCGSADVLEALGVDIALDAARAAAMLADAGMTFLFAPAFHPAMRFVAPVRKELGVPTIMNLVGPLANPAGVRRQVIGVADPDRAPVVAGALGRLGVEHALVVHAAVGMDEIAPAGETHVWEIRDSHSTEWTIDADEFGLGGGDLDALAGGEPAENARRIERLLHEPGEDRPGRAAVILNAGAAIYVAGHVASLRDGIACATAVLEEGRAASTLGRLRRPEQPSTSG